MKKILFILFFVGLTNTVKAQSDLKAKIEYEEAEKAYSNADYKTALTKIKQTEQLLTKTNPKIMFLLINIEYELLETDIDIITELRKHCSSFLDKYQNIEGIEDRYKKVYSISESLETLPKTESDIYKYKEKKNKDKEEKNKIQRKNQLLEILKEYKMGLSGVNIGVPFNEIPTSIRNSLVSKSNYYSGTDYYGWSPKKDLVAYSVKYKSLEKPDEGISTVYIDSNNENVCRIFQYTRSGKSSDEENIYNDYLKLVAVLKEKIGVEQIQEEKISDEYVRGYKIKTILNDSYTYKITFLKTIKYTNWVQLVEEIEER